MKASGPAQLAGTAFLLLFLWWTVASVVKYALTFLSLLGELGMALIVVVGEQFKSNIMLLVIWILLFGLFKGVSLGRLVHKSMMAVMTSPAVSDHQECSICLNLDCNVMLVDCRHFFHQSCLEQWRKQKSTCPNCRLPLPSHRQELTWKTVRLFLEKCPYSCAAIGVAWLWLTLR